MQRTNHLKTSPDNAHHRRKPANPNGDSCPSDRRYRQFSPAFNAVTARFGHHSSLLKPAASSGAGGKECFDPTWQQRGVLLAGTKMR
ncbi:hypothetical protein ZHAS_00022261 [Anopheles sinensis]|uniref:Uncharacterized protein n=1 Tax=Anopheles sinensis TaxID=74873 RepID=A0A084WUW3_ANOSI|nr:hypothetical protein ZHAS_00022261 [Anopheles sinensis]